jgi:hypothetical protein
LSRLLLLTLKTGNKLLADGVRRAMSLHLISEILRVKHRRFPQ